MNAERVSFFCVLERKYIVEEFQKEGYQTSIQSKGNNHNIIIGDIEKAKVFCTAHYDTQAVLPFPNLIVPNNLFGFVLSQSIILICMFILAFPVSFILKPILQYVELANVSFSIAVLLIVLWMFYGKANQHTANDNTSGVVTIVEAAFKMPKECRDEVCFVLFDNEELGLVGSTAFAKEYQGLVGEKLFLNFDCVSDGDDIFFFPTKKIKKENEKHALVLKAFQGVHNKKVRINEGFGFYPSDNLRFQNAYGVCALKKKGFYYLDRIHTRRDIVFDEKNIALLSDGIKRFVLACL